MLETPLSLICKGDPLEIQHPKFENSRLGFIESVHEFKLFHFHEEKLGKLIKIDPRHAYCEC